ncbi:MAG: ribonuclease HI [Desulfovibrionaceae bacterium]
MRKHVIAYTDGSCLGNPGNGGWGVVLQYKEHYKEFFGGFSHTTNNRMEIYAVIEALSVLKEESLVDVYTDSMYVCNAIEQRWLERWYSNGWKTSNKKFVKNRDLWELLHKYTCKHEVSFYWVKAHSGNELNERCDILAKQGAMFDNTREDTGYKE